MLIEQNLRQPGSGHPVADNPLRLLHRPGWVAPQELLRTAEQGQTQSLSGPIAPEEPGHPNAARHRTAVDYAEAARQIAAPPGYAAALAFAPDEWRPPTSQTWPLREANWYLLYAENLPPGDSARSELLALALHAWDDTDAAHTQTSLAVEMTEAQLRIRPDHAAVLDRVDNTLAAVLDQAITQFNPALEAGEMQLLHAIHSFRRLPVPESYTRLAAAIPLAQCLPVGEFLDLSARLLADENFTSSGSISETDFLRLGETVRHCARAVEKVRQAPDVPLPLGERLRQELATRRAMIAMILVTKAGRWAEAAEIIAGLGRENLRPAIEPEIRAGLHIILAGLPLLVEQSQHPQNDVTPALDQLAAEYPHLAPLSDWLRQAAHALRQGASATDAANAASLPVARRSGKNIRPPVTGITAVTATATPATAAPEKPADPPAPARPAPSIPPTSDPEKARALQERLGKRKEKLPFDNRAKLPNQAPVALSKPKQSPAAPGRTIAEALSGFLHQARFVLAAILLAAASYTIYLLWLQQKARTDETAATNPNAASSLPSPDAFDSPANPAAPAPETLAPLAEAGPSVPAPTPAPAPTPELPPDSAPPPATLAAADPLPSPAPLPAAEPTPPLLLAAAEPLPAPLPEPSAPPLPLPEPAPLAVQPVPAPEPAPAAPQPAPSAPEPAPSAPTPAPAPSAAPAPALALGEIVYYDFGPKDSVKAAKINNWVYSEGDDLKIFPDDGSAPLLYKVETIAPTTVTLRRGAQKITLSLGKKG